MAEYIEREALLNSIGLIQLHFVAHGDNKSLFDIINEQPAADVAPVVHGEWVERADYNFDVYYDCSACGESFCFIEGVPEENFYSYCPNCGAKMDGGKNDAAD